VIHDFTLSVGATQTDESPAGRLHRDIKLRHGVQEDSSPEVLARQVQTAFAKSLAHEIEKLNIASVNVPVRAGSPAESADSGSHFVTTITAVAIRDAHSCSVSRYLFRDL